jgi:outer membrane biogenesis lipoprotein LolB
MREATLVTNGGDSDTRCTKAMTRRLLPIAAVLLGACHGAPSAPRAATLFDEVWQQFDAHYAFFDHGNIDWSALGDAYRDSVRLAADDRERARW